MLILKIKYFFIGLFSRKKQDDDHSFIYEEDE